MTETEVVTHSAEPSAGQATSTGSGQDKTIISEAADEHAIETTKCRMHAGYFIDQYCMIDDPNEPGSEWFPFRLWAAQRQAIQIVEANDKTIILKARQLGLSWLTLGYALWLMVYKPGSVILLFSKTRGDARELMRRLRGMWERLPEWMQPGATKELEEQLQFASGSRAQSFTTTKHSGRSFTASLVVIDEAAFIPFLQQLLTAAVATADAGGQVVVISTNDKEKPNNGFAKLYKRAAEGRSGFVSLFIPWYGRPSRTQEWYDKKKVEEDQDDLWQEYPEKPWQALSGRQSSKRFKGDWIKRIERSDRPLTRYGRAGMPVIPGVEYYDTVHRKRPYIIVIDAAEGDVTSDPTAIAIWDTLMWEEVAFGMGKWEPSATAGYAWRLAQVWNGAIICPERNNHGHAVILALREVYRYKNIYKSPFDKKEGWLTTARTKVLAMDKTAELMEIGEIGVRNKDVLAQLANIEAGTLAAPEGDHDDAAMTCIIAVGALTWSSIKRRAGNRRLVASVSL